MLGSELEQPCRSARLGVPISHVACLHSDLSSMQCHAFFIIACILSSCHPGTCIPGNWHMPCFLSLQSHFRAVVWLQSISIVLCYLCISISLLSHHSACIASLYLYSFAPIMHKAPIISTCI